MEPAELSAEEKETVIKTRLILANSFQELGFPIQVGTVNLDGHALTAEDVERFNQGIDQATTDALLEIHSR
ncbi:MAG: hypothetical protein M1484_05215 [Patescibacteria group bacterium]|nr:hypothetical protein [Patescibacteria group bacterium]